MLRARCGICQKSLPEERTALVPGQRAGNYRRAGASVMRRVCDDCTQAHVDFVRTAQSERRNTPLDSGGVVWSRACDELGIDRDGLWRTDYERRRQLEAGG